MVQRVLSAPIAQAFLAEAAEAHNRHEMNSQTMREIKILNMKGKSIPEPILTRCVPRWTSQFEESKCRDRTVSHPKPQGLFSFYALINVLRAPFNSIRSESEAAMRIGPTSITISR